MIVRRVARFGVRAVLPLGAAAMVVAISAAPALAATNVAVSAGGSAISDGGTLDHNDSLTIKGTSDATTSSRSLKLAVNVPGQGDVTLKTGSASPLQSASLSASLDTSCPDWSSSPCVEAVNGTYTFTFTAGSSSSSSTVLLRVPPASPNGFQATNKGTVVTFTWAPNDEPDLMGYDITDSAGQDITPGGMDAGSVCDSNSCGVNIDFGSSAQGTSDTFVLTARRHTSPGSGGFVSSAPSNAQTVQFPAPPPPPSSAPSSAPHSGGTGGGSGNTGGGTSAGGSGSGGGSTGSVRSGGKTPVKLTGKAATDLRRSLPTVTAAGAPDLPSILTEVKPLPEGSYKPTLAYPDQVSRTKVKSPQGVTASVLHSFHQVLDTKSLWRALAGMAVLMLLAGHLRAFVERVDPNE